MKQTVKKVKIAKNVLANETSASARLSKSINVGSQKAAALPLERNISLSRYLEACGDCV